MNTKNYPFEPCITFTASCQVNNILYFSSNSFNGLFKIDLSTKKQTFLGIFDNCPAFKVNQHRSAYYWNNKIVFAPFICNHVAIFDIETEKTEYIKIKETNDAYYMGSFLDNDNLWLFGGYYTDSFLKINLKTGEVLFSVQLQDCIGKALGIDKKEYIYNAPHIVGNDLYAAVWNTNSVVKFNLTSCEFDFITINEKIKLSFVSYYADTLFLVDNSTSDILQYSITDKKIEKYTLDEALEDSVNKKYSLVIPINDLIIVLPDFGREVLVINKESKKIEKLCDLPAKFDDQKKNYRRSWKRFLEYKVCENVVEVMPYKAGMVITIDSDSKKCDGTLYSYSDEMYEKFDEYYKDAYMNMEDKKNVIYENALYTLEDFIIRI